jgi:hypothetical protein
MDFAHPHFAEPRWLSLAVVAPLLLLAIFRYAAWARRRQLAKLADADLLAGLLCSHSSLRRALKNLLLLLAVAGIALALARPQWGERAEESRILGEDILFVLDCSRSMLAADVRPTRLGRAKLAIMDFVERHAGGRVGLLAFAGEAFLQCPLTFDYEAFRESLMSVEDQTIPVPGTDIGRALDEADRAMEGPSTFTVGDLKDPSTFAAKLKHPTDGVSRFIHDRLSGATGRELANWQWPMGVPASLRESLIKDLNALVRGTSLWDDSAFAGMTIRTETRNALEPKPHGEGLARLNRLLLEDAYPLDLAKKSVDKNERRRIMVLVSDGEDLEKAGITQAKNLGENGTVIYTVGVGTPAGSPIQIVNERGQAETLRESDGRVVVSRLDEGTLRAIAEATRGRYYPLGPVGEGMSRVRRLVESLTDQPGVSQAKRLGIDRFHWLIATVLFLVVGESLIGTRRKPRETPAG